MAYRGLVVDFGGVLTTPLHDAFERFCEKEGVDPGALGNLLRSSYPAEDPESIVILVETGRMPPEEFERRLATILSEGLHRPVAPEGLLARMGETLELEDRMIEAVRALHRHGVRTALLSNSWGLHYYPHDLLGELFDEILISGEVGLRKPDEEIYHLAADGLGLDTSACVFVDDLDVNIRTAELVGMRGLLHEKPEETMRELERLFGVRLGAEPGSPRR
jgi:putative hydrolase of the HAD superfamily